MAWCMKVEFSSAFIKAARKLSGKMLESLKRVRFQKPKQPKTSSRLPTARNQLAIPESTGYGLEIIAPYSPLKQKFQETPSCSNSSHPEEKPMARKSNQNSNEQTKTNPYTQTTIIHPRSLYQKPIRVIRVQSPTHHALTSISAFSEKQSVLSVKSVFNKTYASRINPIHQKMTRNYSCSLKDQGRVKTGL